MKARGPQTLRALRHAGILSALDEHFARAMGRLAEEDSAEVLVAAALCSRAVGRGEVCLDLGRAVAGAADGSDAAALAVLGGLAALRDALEASALVRVVAGETELDAADATPLVLAGDRLYLRRYWQYERRLAAALRRRAADAATASDDAAERAWLRGRLDALFGPASGGEPDWQKAAVALALRRRLAVISGGPGTGKTFTVVKVLALVLERAARLGGRMPRLLLLAPSGKAAARLVESIRRAKRELPCAPEILAAIPDEAATVHRCLGASAESPTRFWHDAQNPLAADLLLLDEASMVDLALMARLLEALPDAAQLVLLGDKDQLASVEAGAVLGELCRAAVPAGGAAGFTPATAAWLHEVTGAPVPVPVAAAAPPLPDTLVVLTRSHRYGAGSGIAALAAAIFAGDAAAAAVLLASGAHPDLELLAPGDLGPLARLAVDRLLPGLRVLDGARMLDSLDRFRILCAHRRGPWGAEAMNRRVEQWLVAAGVLAVGARAAGEHYAGRPILVTRNDYTQGLFNGDVGVVLPAVEARPGGERLEAWFPRPGSAPRLVSTARLPECETVFAMTVHKAQGSEVDEVVVVLPEEPSPLVTRELFYTAITRARRRVTVVATAAAVARAVAQRTERTSGLFEARGCP